MKRNILIRLFFIVALAGAALTMQATEEGGYVPFEKSAPSSDFYNSNASTFNSFESISQSNGSGISFAPSNNPGDWGNPNNKPGVGEVVPLNDATFVFLLSILMYIGIVVFKKKPAMETEEQ